MRRQAHLVALLLLVAAASSAIGQESPKFRGASASDSLPGRYRVALELQPGDELDVVSRRLAATYGGRLEPFAEEGFSGFMILITSTRARLLSSDPRVALVEEMAAVPVAELPAAESTKTAGGDSRVAATVAAESTRPRFEVATNAIPGFGTYTYDGSGNIKSIGDTVSSDSFVYDRLGRLESATLRGEPCAVITAGEPCRTQKFTYDRYGNILTVVSATGPNNALQTQTMAVDESTNRMDKAGSTAATKGTYDARGNLKTYNFGTFEYDGLDMVTEATFDGVRRFHVYSASDERVVTIGRASGIATGADWTIRDPGGRVLRRFTESPSGTFTWAEDYVYRNGQLLAAAVPGPEKIRHFHLDHLGTPRLVTGNGGVQLAEHHYQPFGSELSSSTIDGEKTKFTGHERDTSTLDYMHARYYSPAMGRFLSVDPVLDSKRASKSPQTWNRYAYAENNPILKSDPDGRQAVVPAPAAGPAVPLTAALYHVHQMETNDDYRRAVVERVQTTVAVGTFLAVQLVSITSPGLVNAPAESRNTPQIGRGRPRANEQYRYPQPPNKQEPGDPKKQPPPPVLVDNKKAKAVWKVVEAILKLIAQ